MVKSRNRKISKSINNVHLNLFQINDFKSKRMSFIYDTLNKNGMWYLHNNEININHCKSLFKERQFDQFLQDLNSSMNESYK